jgi:hypothetical protein
MGVTAPPPPWLPRQEYDSVRCSVSIEPCRARGLGTHFTIRRYGHIRAFRCAQDSLGSSEEASEHLLAAPALAMVVCENASPM